MNSWTCPCGKTLRGAGIIPHKRHCRVHLDKVDAQDGLSPTQRRIRRGLLTAAAQMRRAADVLEREALTVTEGKPALTGDTD